MSTEKAETESAGGGVRAVERPEMTLLPVIRSKHGDQLVIRDHTVAVIRRCQRCFCEFIVYNDFEDQICEECEIRRRRRGPESPPADRLLNL